MCQSVGGVARSLSLGAFLVGPSLIPTGSQCILILARTGLKALSLSHLAVTVLDSRTQCIIAGRMARPLRARLNSQQEHVHPMISEKNRSRICLLASFIDMSVLGQQW